MFFHKNMEHPSNHLWKKILFAPSSWEVAEQCILQDTCLNTYIHSQQIRSDKRSFLIMPFIEHTYPSKCIQIDLIFFKWSILLNMSSIMKQFNKSYEIPRWSWLVKIELNQLDHLKEKTRLCLTDVIKLIPIS